VSDENRAHAAVQLGKLHASEGETKKAIACNRWIVASGLADRDDRFFFARFNLGLYYAELRQQARSLSAFRDLLERHPGRTAEVAELFLGSPRTRAVIDRQPGFAEALLRTCPALFTPGDAGSPEEGEEPR
jgi:tetratricopeptide (TPR) repeat protein